MREERTSRCGWEVLTSSRRQGSSTQHSQETGTDLFCSPNTKERSGRGVLSWLNLMSVGESDRTRPGTALGRSLSRLDQAQATNWGVQAANSRSRRTQELCDRWNGLELDIDEILEAPLETNLSHSLANSDRDFQPFIQTEFRQGVLPQGNKAEPLHLFHTIRNRKHVLHCYEFLLMRTLDEDDNLWVKLCEKFGHCDQCEQEGCTPRSPRHSHTATGSLPTKDPFSINSIHPDMWFLAITLKESKDKLIHFIRSELPKRKNDLPLPGSQKPLQTNSFLSSYLSAFNFVEMNLDNVFRFGDVTSLPKELFRCVNLKTLSLRHNFLDTVPPDIGRLSKLERLFLTNNKLQNKSIPFTIAFCMNLTELYIDNNLLDALPGILLSLNTLERVHRHGNHNYFKATFMWYHTDVNDRILECPGTPTPPQLTPSSLQQLCALTVIRSRDNFYRSVQIPTRIKDFISSLCEGLELCTNCSTPRPQSAPSYKVFTFKNPYLGNTCVPFQHWACSLPCAREVEIPARREQLSQAREQDRQYERYVRESLSRLRPSQRALSANNLTMREGVGERQVLGENISYTSINTSQQGVVGQENISCGIL
eukprot:GFUD01018451.1.p1 GENE.GFUD01018451.1~~GFUD01018451.1.p1  ORF type:complete len:594 (+),score=175.32 GFUD01018451.1:101-1882(+)